MQSRRGRRRVWWRNIGTWMWVWAVMAIVVMTVLWEYERRGNKAPGVPPCAVCEPCQGYDITFEKDKRVKGAGARVQRDGSVMVIGKITIRTMESRGE